MCINPILPTTSPRRHFDIPTPLDFFTFSEIDIENQKMISNSLAI